MNKLLRCDKQHAYCSYVVIVRCPLCLLKVKSNIENFKTEGQNMEQQRKSIMTDLEVYE